jgi:hypothetical protein
MFPNQVAAALPEELATEVFTHAHASEKALYREILAGAASMRRFRPAFLEKMPRAQRHVLMRQYLAQPTTASIAHAFQLVSSWLINTRQPMLAAFLDTLQIPHDGSGCAESFPAAPDKSVIAAAVNHLLQTFPAPEVAVYLHSFNAMPDTRWPGLDELLVEKPELRLGTPAA